MKRLRGTSWRTGMAMGQVAAATRRGGPPVPPEGYEQPEEVSEFTARPEPPDVVLVLDDPADLRTAWPDWCHVVAVVSEAEATGGPPIGLPFVSGVVGIGRATRDGDLLLVDADRGVVTVDPDMRAVAEFQQAREGVRVGSRFVLGYAHLPAATLDGVSLRIAATAASAGDVDHAMRGGADALVVPWSGGAPAEVETRLRRLSKLAAGKPITVLQDGGALSSMAMARAAAAVDLTVALPASSGPEVAANWLVEIAKAREALLSDASASGEPRLAAWVSLGAQADVSALPVSRLVVRAGAGSWPPDRAAAAWLDEVVVAAMSACIAVELEVPSADTHAIEAAIGAGAAAVIVRADQVAGAKDLVRSLRADECRAGMRLFIACGDVGPNASEGTRE